MHLVALLGGRDVFQQDDVGAGLDIVGGVVAPRRPHREVGGEVPVEARLDLVGPGEPRRDPAVLLGSRDLGDQRRRPGARRVIVEEQPHGVGDLSGPDRLDAEIRDPGVQDAGAPLGRDVLDARDGRCCRARQPNVSSRSWSACCRSGALSGTMRAICSTPGLDRPRVGTDVLEVHGTLDAVADLHRRALVELPGADGLVEVGADHRQARRIDELRLVLRVELGEHDLRRRLDLPLRERGGVRHEAERVEAAGDLRAEEVAVVPVRRPQAAEVEAGRVRCVDRATIEEGDLDRVRRIGEVDHRHAALVPRLDEDVSVGHRHQRGVVGDAVLLRRLDRRHLVVAGEHHLPVDSAMSKMASAPHFGWSVARQRADVPPPHSSVKMTFVPSLLSVAECQYEKFGSDTASRRTGFTGSEMSSRMPLPWQAPAARPSSGIGRDVVARVRVRQRRVRGAGRMQRARAACSAGR